VKRKVKRRKNLTKRIKTASYKTLKARAWDLFSVYVRRKYADENGYVTCYTSGVRDHWKTMQCGHAIPGRGNAVLFDEEICRPQTVSENVFKRGNYTIFTTKLIKERGMDWWEAKLAGSNKPVKFTRSDLQALIDRYKLPPE